MDWRLDLNCRPSKTRVSPSTAVICKLPTPARERSFPLKGGKVNQRASTYPSEIDHSINIKRLFVKDPC